MKNSFSLPFKRQGVMEKTENSGRNILEVNTECNLPHPLSTTRAGSGCDIKASRKRVSYQYLRASVPYTPYQSRALHRNGLSIRAVIVLPDNSVTALWQRGMRWKSPRQINRHLGGRAWMSNCDKTSRALPHRYSLIAIRWNCLPQEI